MCWVCVAFCFNCLFLLNVVCCSCVCVFCCWAMFLLDRSAQTNVIPAPVLSCAFVFHFRCIVFIFVCVLCHMVSKLFLVFVTFSFWQITFLDRFAQTNVTPAPVLLCAVFAFVVFVIFLFANMFCVFVLFSFWASSFLDRFVQTNVPPALVLCSARFFIKCISAFEMVCSDARRNNTKFAKTCLI